MPVGACTKWILFLTWKVRCFVIGHKEQNQATSVLPKARSINAGRQDEKWPSPGSRMYPVFHQNSIRFLCLAQKWHWMTPKKCRSWSISGLGNHGILHRVYLALIIRRIDRFGLALAVCMGRARTLTRLPATLRIRRAPSCRFATPRRHWRSWGSVGTTCYMWTVRGASTTCTRVWQEVTSSASSIPSSITSTTIAHSPSFPMSFVGTAGA